jgi:hypothetical protein
VRARRDKAKGAAKTAFVTRLTGILARFRKYCIAQTFVSSKKFFLFPFNLLTGFETLA